ncbi:MAG: hypothetical protein IKW77_04720 [Salinivirgaceae bacterium]|nr:hypothetical protein [Salinivirgaceae bacterium]
MFRYRNTKAFKFICLTLACSVLLTSCHSTQYVSLQDDYNAKLNGKTHAEIIELLGPPDRTASNGKDGEILIYEVKSQKGSSANGKFTNSINLTETKKQTNVFIDGNKVCYNVTTDDVKEEKVFDKKKTIVGLGLVGILTVWLLIAASESGN